MEHITLKTAPQEGYALLDSGREEKLERFGEVRLVRPDPQALWEKNAPEDWGHVEGKYERTDKEGKWVGKDLPKSWEVPFGGIVFSIQPTTFKHTGLFPEQLSNWEWASEAINKAGRPVKVLNLFGYTGGATLSAAKAGAEVVHIDGSKSAVAWARENAALSGLAEAPIRWIVEDARTFVEREVRRGNTYDAVIMDPPAFGHGPEGEVWKFEEDFLPLMRSLEALLSDHPLFVLVNGYAAGYSPLAFAYNLEGIEKKNGGTIQYGELYITEEKGGRDLPAGIFSRWSA